MNFFLEDNAQERVNPEKLIKTFIRNNKDALKKEITKDILQAEKLARHSDITKNLLKAFTLKPNRIMILTTKNDVNKVTGIVAKIVEKSDPELEKDARKLLDTIGKKQDRLNKTQADLVKLIQKHFTESAKPLIEKMNSRQKLLFKASITFLAFSLLLICIRIVMSIRLKRGQNVNPKLMKVLNTAIIASLGLAFACFIGSFVVKWYYKRKIRANLAVKGIQHNKKEFEEAKQAFRNTLQKSIDLIIKSNLPVKIYEVITQTGE